MHPLPWFAFSCVAFKNSVHGFLVRGTILRRTERCGVFSRIGVFFIPHGGDYKNTEPGFAFNRQSNTINEDDYLSFHSMGECTIRDHLRVEGLPPPSF